MGAIVFYRDKDFRSERDLWGAHFRWLHTFRSERDLWGCSFAIVIKIPVMSGISGGAHFLWFHTFRSAGDLWGCPFSIVILIMISVLSGISGICQPRYA